MNRLFLRVCRAASVCALVLFFAAPASAQRYEAEPPPPAEPDYRRTGITVNPLAFLFGTANVEIEHGFHDRFSLFAGPQLLFLDDIFGVGVQGGARVFMIGHAPEGFWIGPQFTFAYASVGDATGVAYGLGGLLGYTFIFENGFDLSLGAGAQYLAATAKSADASASLDGVYPILRASIGYAF